MAVHSVTPTIVELGHVGLHCTDPEHLASFYVHTLGLTITDSDTERRLYFLSSRPGQEHHELLLLPGRRTAPGTRLVQQISFRCDSLEAVQAFLERFRRTGVPVEKVVSHGNAVGVYFFDPEGNRGEVYWQTGWSATQPYLLDVDLEQDADQVIETLKRHVTEYGSQDSSDSRPSTDAPASPHPTTVVPRRTLV